VIVKPEQSFLLIVDVQDRLAPAIHQSDEVIASLARLVKAARRLGIPVRVLEENPAGLGHTVPPLAKLVEPDSIIEKMYFSCAREPDCVSQLRRLNRNQVIVGGTETHVCVLQSALGLLEQGFTPFVVEDASSSRRIRDHQAGIGRMRESGCTISTSEMVLFEWLERAGTQAFRDVLEFIK
jgi:nicotinamidase-related amidase